MEGIRSEILGAPGGRTRYPITMRRIKLEAPMETSAMIKTKGVIVNGNRFSSLEWPCFRLIRIVHNRIHGISHLIGKRSRRAFEREKGPGRSFALGKEFDKCPPDRL
jgi:hypothetical protein